MNVSVELGKDSYDVRIESGSIRDLQGMDLQRKVLVVTDSGVPVKYMNEVASQCKEPVTVTIPMGEGSKSLKIYEMLLGMMLRKGFTRKDCVVAVGGGVVGDLAGFVSATYMRGVDFYNIPTTLLSQVDSSVGGKTAIDFMGVKNIVGAFHQPKMVVIDPETLDSLDDRQFRNGLVEAIKMGAVLDKNLFDIIDENDPRKVVGEIIRLSVQAKAKIVSTDEKESGLRKVLNFGHTLGHGLEAASCGKLLHGESVGIGMIPMAFGDAKERILSVLKKQGLPIRSDCPADIALDAIRHDKKSQNGEVYCVTTKEIGTFEMKKYGYEDLKVMLEEAKA